MNEEALAQGGKGGPLRQKLTKQKKKSSLKPYGYKVGSINSLPKTGYSISFFDEALCFLCRCIYNRFQFWFFNTTWN